MTHETNEAETAADQQARQLLRQLARGAHMASFAAKHLRTWPPDLFDQVGATVGDVQRLSMLWHGAMGARDGLEAASPRGGRQERYERYVELVDAVRLAHRSARALQEERPEEFSACGLTDDDADELERLTFAVLRGFDVFLSPGSGGE